MNFLSWMTNYELKKRKKRNTYLLIARKYIWQYIYSHALKIQEVKQFMNYNDITTLIENHINYILSDPVYTEKQRQDFAYGAYLAWHALVGEAFLKEDDIRLWSLVCYCGK